MNHFFQKQNRMFTFQKKKTKYIMNSVLFVVGISLIGLVQSSGYWLYQYEKSKQLPITKEDKLYSEWEEEQKIRSKYIQK